MLDDVIMLFFPVLLVPIEHFNCIVQDSLYHDMDIGTMCDCALVSCTPSQLKGLVLGCAFFWCWASLYAPFTVSLIDFPLIMIFIIIIVTIIGMFMAILFIMKYSFRLSVTKWFWFCECATPLIFPALDILLQYWVEHVTFGLHYVMFTFLTRISYWGVPGFATDCHCGVWCRGITTCLIYDGPILEYSLKRW